MPKRCLAVCLVVEEVSSASRGRRTDPPRPAAGGLDALLGEIAARYLGELQPPLEGGRRLLVFLDAVHAAEACGALLYQSLRGGSEEDRPGLLLALRTGTVALDPAGATGPAVDRCLAQLPHCRPGIAVLCGATRSLLIDDLAEDLAIEEIGAVTRRGSSTEQLFGLRLAGPPESQTWIESSEGERHNIPSRTTSLVGREQEMDEIDALLRRRRLVSIVGPGGSGKTALAQEAGRRLAADYPDGAWFVRLVEATDRDSLEQAVALALRPLVGQVAPGTQVRQLVGGRRLLLILDNCEHLLQEIARFSHSLLTHCRQAKILITSRHALNVIEESILAVAPLSLPDLEAESLEHLETSPAVRLFLDRAQAKVPGFRLTLDNAKAVASICIRLEGLPLAIEQVASYVGKLTPDQIEKRISSSFVLLHLPAETGEPRHSTMYAVIQWSTGLLSPAAQKLFGSLGVFAGSWSLEAVEFLAGGIGLTPGEALQAHGELLDSSLVLRLEDPAGEIRYRFLESVREFALETTPVSDQVRTIHLNWYRFIAIAADSELQGPELGPWTHLLEVERDNLRSALLFGWQSRSPDYPSFAVSLRRFWHRSGQHHELIQWLENALAMVPADRAELKAEILNALGAGYWRLAKWQEAELYYRQSLEIWTSLGNLARMGQCCANLAICRTDTGDVVGALTLYREACQLARKAGDERGLGSALMNLGHLQSITGDWITASATLDEAAEYLRKHGNVGHLLFAVANSARVAWAARDRNRYFRLVYDQIDMLESAHDRSALGNLLMGLASNSFDAGRPEICLGALDQLHAVLGCPARLSSREHQDRYAAMIRELEENREFAGRAAAEIVDWPQALRAAREITDDFLRQGELEILTER